METSKLKNMIILRNLPSNLVEEAIVILKSNKKIKKLEKVENIEKSKNKETKEIEKKDNNYILKEAEMLISNYISKIEGGKNKITYEQKKQNKKIKNLKKYAIISSSIIFLETLLIMIK